MIEGVWILYVIAYMSVGISTANLAYDSIKDIGFTDETWERVALGFVGIIWPVFWLTVVYALIVQWNNDR